MEEKNASMNEKLKLNELEIRSLTQYFAIINAAQSQAEAYGKALVDSRGLQGMYTVDDKTWTLVKQEPATAVRPPELKIAKKE